jgi:hypothetical protein
MGAFVFSTRSAGAAINFLATAPTDGSTAELPVFSSALCRAGEPCLNGTTNARITYHAISFDVANGGADEVDGTASYNPWHEAITTGGFAAGVAPGASDSSNAVAIDAAEWALTPAKGLMIVTLDNKNGPDEAQLVDAKKYAPPRSNAMGRAASGRPFSLSALSGLRGAGGTCGC